MVKDMDLLIMVTCPLLNQPIEDLFRVARYSTQDFIFLFVKCSFFIISDYGVWSKKLKLHALSRPQSIAQNSVGKK